MSWSLVKLDSVISFIRGVTFKPDELVEPFTEGSVVVMRTKNVQVTGLSTKDLIAVPKIIMRRNEQQLKCGDLLISSANSWELVGKASYISKLGYEATAGGFISIVRPKMELIHSRYLYHWITSPNTQHKIRYCGRKTTNISNLDVGRFKALEIPLPYPDDPEKSLKEQKRIAAILDKADGIRRKRQQAIQLADDFLRSVFLDMFGDPVTNPKGIEVRPMTEVFNITTGKLNSNAAVEGGAYPFFTCAKEIFYIDNYAFDMEALLLAGNNAQAEYDVKHYIGRFNAYQRTYVLTLQDSKSLYPFYKVALEYQLENLKRVSKGSSTKYITMEIMNRTLLPVPDYIEQNKFVDIYNKHVSNLAKNNKFDNELFDSLSQKAFKGEL